MPCTPGTVTTSTTGLMGESQSDPCSMTQLPSSNTTPLIRYMPHLPYASWNLWSESSADFNGHGWATGLLIVW